MSDKRLNPMVRHFHRSAMILVLGLAACSPFADDDEPAVESAPEATAAEQPSLHEVQRQIAPIADSIDSQLRLVSALSGSERSNLRRDLNAEQIARARAMGVRISTTVDPLVADGQLVRLADTTQYWIIRELDYSIPYATPATEAMLAEIGRRFHARLDSLNVPRYRLDITSIMRTPEKQAALRQSNSNASKTVSAHEFGTTVDIAYRSFAPPVEITGHLLGPARKLADSLLVQTAEDRGAELQAVLGRVIQDMKDEGRLMVMMERSQTVYHITVAKRYPDAERVPPQ